MKASYCMLHQGLLLLLCFPAAIQAQYGTPTTPNQNTPIRDQTRSQIICPWLTQGTAARALGGDVSVTVQMTNAVEGSCRFLRHDSRDSLIVLVSKTDVSKCLKASSNLRGIGNEAVRCTVPGSRGEEVEMINSRIRDLHFNVTRSFHRERTSAKATDLQDDALEQVAETIAGNLY
jgi:hypothetical protein